MAEDIFHWVQCAACNKTTFQKRHAEVKRGLIRTLKSKLFSQSVRGIEDEPKLPGLAGGGNGGAGAGGDGGGEGVATAIIHRADILVKAIGPEDPAYYLDVAVTAPTSRLNALEMDAILRFSGRTDRAMEKMAGLKMSFYNRLVPTLVAQKLVIPFVLCATGRISSHASDFIDTLTGEFDSYLRPLTVHLGAIIVMFNAKTVLFNRRRLA